VAEPANGWSKAQLSDIGTISVPDTLEWTPVRRHFGIQAFGVNAYTAAEVGQEVVERHTEEVRGHEELYVVISGRAAFTLDGEEADAPMGTALFIKEPSVERSAIAMEPGTTVLAMGGKPGTPYTPGPWEWVFAASAMGESGDYERAVSELEDGLEVLPDNPALLYRLACWEAVAGRDEDALVHLTSAVARREGLREHAWSEDAFASIRDDPRFPAAT
jgi:mannose-6-phosphate isomerase-like protein (cupin superfamily)